jgi:prevent-host-death family protein
MIVINVSQLKAKLSENLGKVKNGEQIIVTDRRSPVARISPYSSAEDNFVERKAVVPFRARRCSRPSVIIDAQGLLNEERGDR